MVNHIKIFNPNEMPFGPLSNNYTTVIKDNDRLYSSVSNYIYSNMLGKTVRDDASDIGTYLKLQTIKTKELILTALVNAFQAKVNSSSEISDLLSNTENSVIFYEITDGQEEFEKLVSESLTHVRNRLDKIPKVPDLSNLISESIDKRNDKILEIYLYYILEKNYPKLEKEKYKKAIDEQFSQRSFDKRRIISERLYKLYKEDPSLISEELLSRMRMGLKDIEEMITKYKTQTEDTDKDVLNKVVIKDNVNENKPELRPFSILDNSVFFELDGLVYPTVFHYLYTILFSKLYTVTSVEDAYYKYIANRDIPQVTNLERYTNPNFILSQSSNLKTVFEAEHERFLAYTALNKKFEDPDMQDVLLATGNDIIVWNDPMDSVLGGNGENFVGDYLMKLRESITRERLEIPTRRQTVQSEMAILLNNTMVKNWIYMRASEYCSIIVCMEKYYNSLSNTAVSIDANFVENVLDIIYGKDKFPTTRNMEIPISFKNFINENLKIKNNYEKLFIIPIIWLRVIVMLEYLCQYNISKNNRVNIPVMLMKIQKVTTTAKSISKNSIICAIVNLIKKVRKFHDKFRPMASKLVNDE